MTTVGNPRAPSGMTAIEIASSTLEAMNPTVDAENNALAALGALAQALRLRAFRALVVAGDAGMTAGALAEALGVSPSALSFHLKELTHVGLVESESRGRFMVYRARFERMNGLLGYLTEHCCQGQDCAVTAPRGARRC